MTSFMTALLLYQRCQLLRDKSREKFTDWCKKKEAEMTAAKRKQADKEEQKVCVIQLNRAHAVPLGWPQSTNIWG